MVTTLRALPQLPALVPGTVRHMRRQPMRHAIRFRTYQWLIDVDAPPNHAPWISFPVRDHFGGGAPTLRAAIRSFVEGQGGVVADDERIVMLAGGRVFGHGFDPLSVFWGLSPQGEVRWAVLEIHNTYGERHAHLVRPDNGRASVPKAFYVSPFMPVDGHYDVRLVLGAEYVAVAIVLERAGQRVFTATFSGAPRPLTPANLARAMLRTPLASWQTSMRIRVHGIWLWLRRLPIIPRPHHDTQRGFR